MHRELLKDTVLYSLSSVVARGASVITVPVFTRLMSPADYGALDLLTSLALILGLMVGLALDQAVGRYYFEARTDDDRRAIATTVLIYSLIAPIPVVLFGALIADKAAYGWLEGQVSGTAVTMACAYVWAYCMFAIATNILRYRLEAKKFALCSVGNALFSMAFSVYLLVSIGLGVVGVLFAQTASMACFALVAIYMSRGSYGATFDWSCFSILTKYSLPLMPSSIAFFAGQYLDRYVLNEMRGLHEVGLYGLAARVASLVLIVISGFQGAWFPLVMKTYKDPGAAEKFQLVLEYFALITCTMLIWISIFGEEILRILTSGPFWEAYMAVPLLVASAILLSFGTYFTFGIQIAKRSTLRLAINLSGLVINFALNIVLIKAFGFMGAAMAAFVSALFIAVSAMWVSQQVYFVAHKWSRLAGALVFSLVSSYAVGMLGVVGSIAEMSVKVVAGLAATGMVVLILRPKGIYRSVIAPAKRS